MSDEHRHGETFSGSAILSILWGAVILVLICILVAVTL